MDQLVAKHKKEAKDLLATITGMKKQANKKNRKQVNKKCQEMEEEMKKRHAQEIEELEDSEEVEEEEHTKDSDDEDSEEEDEFSPEALLRQIEEEKKEIEMQEMKEKQEKEQKEQKQPKAKRNRQKERLARRQAEQDKLREEAANEAADQVDYGKLEKDNLDQLCEQMKLIQFDIKPDGNCLFASISDQLIQRHGVNVSVKDLRAKAAEHIKKNESQFQPFLFDEKSLTMGDIDAYVDKIKNTSEWGGDMEILALAEEYDCPVSVVMSGQAVHRVNENGRKPELKLIYYKHVYGLGEHYNSLRDGKDVREVGEVDV